MYNIRQATIHDWPEISAFIDRTYGSGAPYKQQARCEWQFRCTPYPAEEGDDLPIWIALQGSRVIGAIALQPGEMSVNGALLPFGWIVDVMIDADHRGHGLGHQILAAVKASGRNLLTLTMAAATRRMMEKAGCITLPPVYQMVRPVGLTGKTIGAVLEQISGNRPGYQHVIDPFVRTKLGPSAVAAVISLYGRLVGWRGAKGRLSFEEGHLPPDGDIDRLATHLATKVAVMADRSSRFYRWRFETVPVLDYRFSLTRSEGDVRALVVWRLPDPVELPVGTIADILCDPDDKPALDGAIAAAIEQMEGKVEAIIAGASDRRFVSALSRHGFVVVKKHRPTLVSRDPKLLERFGAVGGPWHFSKADHDWDQIHPVAH